MRDRPSPLEASEFSRQDTIFHRQNFWSPRVVMFIFQYSACLLVFLAESYYVAETDLELNPPASFSQDCNPNLPLKVQVYHHTQYV